MLRSVRFWIGCTISLILLFLFFYDVDFREIGRALAEARYIFILPTVIVLLLVVGIKTVRWQYLLKPLGAVGLRTIFPVEVIGHMVNAILPLRAGELARSYLLGEKASISKVSTLGTVAVARAFDGLALLVLAVVLSLFLPLVEWLGRVIYVIAALFICLIIVILILASSQKRLRKISTFLLKPLPHKWSSKLQIWLDLFIEGLNVIRSPRRVFGVFLLSLLVWLSEGLMFYLMSFAFNLSQPFHVLLLASVAANVALLLPSSPGGVGNFEYFSAQTISFFGVEMALARSYAIVVHATLLIPIILLGFYLLWKENISLVDITRRAKQEDILEHESTNEKQNQ